MAGDTVGLTQQWSVLVAASGSWLTSRSYSKTGAITAHYDAFGISPTLSVIYKPVADLTTYITYADALQHGDTLTTTSGTTILPPYRSTEFELGSKMTVRESRSTCRWRCSTCNGRGPTWSPAAQSPTAASSKISASRSPPRARSWTT